MSTQPPAIQGRAATPARPAAGYHRTIIGFHGTRKDFASELVAGAPFRLSRNDDDWLGHGIYFWEHAPLQAWSWAARRYGPAQAGAVGALIALGRCLDLLDPENADLVRVAERKVAARLEGLGAHLNNVHRHKFLDCAVFNFLLDGMDARSQRFDTCRAVFVPVRGGKGLPRLWPRSGIFEGAHIQVSIRSASNILAVWPIRRDGTHGTEA